MFYLIRCIALFFIIISLLINFYQTISIGLSLRMIFPLLIVVTLLFKNKEFRFILRFLSAIGIVYFFYSESRNTAGVSGFYFTTGIINFFHIEKNTLLFYILISVPIFIYPLLFLSTFTQVAKKNYSK